MSSPASTKKMTYARLGNSGLKVSKIILGCMTYGSPTWAPWLLNEEEGIRHIKTAYEAGINTFDTANVYSNGLSEVILGKAIKELNLPREEIVVMTKFAGVVDRTPEYKGAVYSNFAAADQDGYVNQWGGSRKHIFATVKASLERLQLEYIDVLQYHRVDPFTPIEETMQALHDVVKAGYVRYIGMSSCRAWQFHIMQNYAITNKLTPFISMQNHYNLVYREEEREMFPTLKHFGVGSIPWSPLARGMLTRPINEQTSRGGTDAMLQGYDQREGNHTIVKRLEEIAKKKEVTMAQVALAWSLSKEGVAAPVVGTTSIKNLMDLIDAVDLKLTEEEIKYLEEPYEAQAIYGFY
ncbi:aryl-alcohol dehydrogenase [Gymnopus androsaceus JB14]|uniref:Aryl-alcohol dehydrogenase n=1 Tax=Gymnopus androsaceus JB14 TaxID=1447944 RepID=A0A6A4HF66_9AGAR|nr:aryl-alcohol dehydrogenase [Gymnopus androsaceus JB14]